MRNGIKTHKDLDVWKDSIELVTKIYRLVSNFPKEERFGLVDQMKRAAISIPSNIAEGAARNSQKEFLQFLHVALGSIAELETQLIISKKLGFLNNESIFEDLEKIKSRLLGLIRYLKKKKNEK